METVVFILLGIAIGLLIGWILAKSKFQNTQGVSHDMLEANYIPKEYYNEVKSKYENLELSHRELLPKHATLEEENRSLKERHESHKEEIKQLKESFSAEFENLSNRLLEEKGQQLLRMNTEKISNILDPLKIKIQDFQKTVEENTKEDIAARTHLKDQLGHIVEMNKELSEGAERLTKALKGDSKLQGNWGEDQLKVILEKAGLEKDIHYSSQVSLQDEHGNRNRPDYVINLPDNKSIIIDSKVSLTHYEQFFNSDDEEEKKVYLKAHLNSIEKHIKGLSEKKYQSLYNIDQPDYVIMFVPIDPALTVALNKDSKLYEKALEKNIVLVSVSTLLATLRTISYIWKQDKLKKNVDNIARESGSLYDKFVSFVKDLKNVGDKLDKAKGSWDNAMNKLVTSSQYGGTIVGKVEKLKKLYGADATKSIPQDLTDKVDDEINDEDEMLENKTRSLPQHRKSG